MQKLIYPTILLFMYLTGLTQNLNERWLEQINQGKELYAVNKYADAMLTFKKASQMVPTDTTAYVYLMDCAYKTQNTPVFFECFDKLSLLNYKSAHAYHMAVNLCIDVLKDYAKAVQYVEAAKQEFSEDKEILMADVMIYFKYGDYNAAREKLKYVLSKYPDTKRAIDLLYHIQYNIEKNPQAALETLDLAKKTFPNEVEYTKKEVNIYFETGQMDAAEEKFRKLIEMNPDDAKHYYNLSLILYNKGEYQQSVELASKAIENDPEFIEAIFNVGTFFYHRALKYNQALLDMTPYQYTYQAQGRDIELTAKSYFEAALPYFERAIQLNTDELDAFENLNTIKALLKNIDNNQQLTQPYFTNLDNEEIHKVYPNYAIDTFELIYPVGQSKIEKGQEAIIKLTVKNTSNNSVNQLDIRLFQPFVNPQVSYSSEYTIGKLGAMETRTIELPVHYLPNSSNTLGIEQPDNNHNIIRFFVTGNDKRYSDMKQVKLSLGTAAQPVQLAEQKNNQPSPKQTKGNNFLFIIAIDNYAHWTNTDTNVSEAREVEQTLTSLYEVEKSHTFSLYDEKATRNNIINELIKIRGEIQPDDNLIIYFNGRTKNINDQGYWITANAEKENPGSYLDNTTLLSFLNAINTSHMLVMVNGYFNNKLFVPKNKVTFKPGNDTMKSRWGLANNNIANEEEEITGGSAFNQGLLEALKNGTGNGLSASYLISSVKQAMSGNDNKAPLGGPLDVDGNEGGDFILYKK